MSVCWESKHTRDSVREYLPDLKIKINGEVKDARVCGRLNQFGTVYLHGYAGSWEFTWDAIAHSLNSRKPLEV